MREPPAVSGRSWRFAGAGDEDALQALLERCGDYFELVEEREPGPGAAGELLRTRPPGTDPGDKIVLVLTGDSLDGVVDVIRDWPVEGTWLVGLLLLDPALRGRGIGAEVVAALDRWAAGEGAQRLRVAVVHGNARALRFWRGLSFEEVPPLGPDAVALERPVARRESAP